VAVGHNGNLVNAVELRERLEAEGSIFQTTSDTEVIVHLIAKSRERSLPERTADALLDALTDEERSALTPLLARHPLSPELVVMMEPTDNAIHAGCLGNILVHSRKERRYRCTTCGRTCAATHDTPLYRLKKPTELVIIVLTLLCHGCPLQAIVAAFGLDERTVADWRDRAGRHARQVHDHQVLRGQVELGHVQADELYVKAVGRRLWMAMAMAVPSRLWLGGVVSERRDLGLILAVLAAPMVAVVVLAQALRWWCITTLGPRWNTRVVVVPGLPLVARGPYRWLNHPNYVAVVAEGIALPLVGSAWVTAITRRLSSELTVSRKYGPVRLA